MSEVHLGIVRARYNPFGGAERFVARAAGALAGLGADITVIARSWDAEDGALPKRVRLVRCDPFYVGSVWRDWSFARAVRTFLASERFDLVQSHERIVGLPIFRAGDGVHAAWLLRRGRATGFIARCGVALNLHHRYLVATEKAMFEDSRLKAVICNSSMVRDEILARFKIEATRVHLIANGIDLEDFSPEAAAVHRASVRQSLGIAADVPVLVLVGSGFARKGVAVALRALAASTTTAEIIVVGLDKHAPRYHRLAADLGLARRAHFVGEQKNTLPYLGAADAFILPTIYDPFPNAVLEALASGLPVLVSDGCGAMDVVAEGSNGWVMKTGDVDAFAGAIATVCQAIASPESIRLMRAAARASVADYSLEAMAAKLLTLYRQLLEAGEGSGAR